MFGYVYNIAKQTKNGKHGKNKTNNNNKNQTSGKTDKHASGNVRKQGRKYPSITNEETKTDDCKMNKPDYFLPL